MKKVFLIYKASPLFCSANQWTGFYTIWIKCARNGFYFKIQLHTISGKGCIHVPLSDLNDTNWQANVTNDYRSDDMNNKL